MTILGRALALLCLVSSFALIGCAQGEKVEEGDAEIVSQTEKNENPDAKSKREQSGGGAASGATMEPPPEGN